MGFPELIASVHGFIGTVFLMAFAGAFAELIELTHAGVRRIKWGVGIMTGAMFLLVTSGLWTYIFYRAPVPDSPRSILKAGDTPWVHEILFELKEHVGVFPLPIMLIALYIVLVHDKELRLNKKFKWAVAALLVMSLVVTLAVYGMGVYVTKIVPL
jgi:hypothetical protein